MTHQMIRILQSVFEMRVRGLLLVAAVFLAMSQGKAFQPENVGLSVKAWSSSAGPYGITWYLEMGADGAAAVTRWAGPGEKGMERRFTVALEDRSAIQEAVEEAMFFQLPESLAAALIPLHGPENCLEVELAGRVRKVFLYDPKKESGPEAERFKRVWASVVARSPIKPPL